MAEKLPARLGQSEQTELRRLEQVVQESLQIGQDAAIRTRLAMIEIRDKRFYRESHPSMAAYAHDRWRISKSTYYRWIEQGHALLELEDAASKKSRAAGLVDQGERAKTSPKLPSQRAIARDRKRKAIETSSTEIDANGQGKLDQQASAPRARPEAPAEVAPSAPAAASTGSGTTTMGEVWRRLLGDDLLVAVDRAAAEAGISRVDWVRATLSGALSEPVGAGRRAKQPASAGGRQSQPSGPTSNGKADPCPHPVGRRLGSNCGACGESLKRG